MKMKIPDVIKTEKEVKEMWLRRNQLIGEDSNGIRG